MLTKKYLKVYGKILLFLEEKIRCAAEANPVTQKQRTDVDILNFDAKDPELEELRAKYWRSRRELGLLQESCRDTEAMLKDMRSALFTVRVAAQALDEADISALPEVTATLNQQRDTLTHLCNSAKGLKQGCFLHRSVLLVFLLSFFLLFVFKFFFISQ